MSALDPSQILDQLVKEPGAQSGKMGGYEAPMFEGSNKIEVGGRSHMQRGGYVTENAPEAPHGGLKSMQRGKIEFEGSTDVQVGGYDHINDPRFERDVMRAPEALKGHMEPWLRDKMLPEIPRDKVMYEGSCEVDVGGRDHFGAGGQGRGWVPDNYHAPGEETPEYNNPDSRIKNQRPHTPSARFARGEKVRASNRLCAFVCMYFPPLIGCCKCVHQTCVCLYFNPANTCMRLTPICVWSYVQLLCDVRLTPPCGAGCRQSLSSLVLFCDASQRCLAAGDALPRAPPDPWLGRCTYRAGVVGHNQAPTRAYHHARFVQACG